MIDGRSCDANRVARFPRGFTLIEIMVVVVILGILAVLIVPRVVGRTDDARAVAAKQDVAAVMQALKLYRLDNGRYPSTEQGLPALVAKPQSAPAPTNWKQYLDRIPKDPWGNAYLYLNPACTAKSTCSRSGGRWQARRQRADTNSVRGTCSRGRSVRRAGFTLIEL